MINRISDNKLMESFYTMIPYFKYYFGEEVGFTISNTEKFLYVQSTEKLKINFTAGEKIPEGSAAYMCLEKKEVVEVIIPENVFGFLVKTIAVPVFEGNEIAGTMVISISIDKMEKINQVNNLAESVSESLSDMTINVKEMTDVFQRINQTNENIEDSIHKTQEYYKKTDDIINFINSVTKKTNLLGLNASIEAARAGETGKGFSVVASEIRNLSDSTKESLSQISNVLNSIQTSIDDIYGRFQSSNKYLEAQVNGLENIKTAIEKLNANVVELNEFAKDL